MRALIITAGNRKRFAELRNFVASLRASGAYDGAIAICDNEISGTWRRDGSFTAEQLRFSAAHDARVFPPQKLIDRSAVSEGAITAIPSPTQRYPYKFLYDTLISKEYVDKVDLFFYFDSDVYCQRPVEPILRAPRGDALLNVKEWLKMGKVACLPKWLAFASFSAVSSQDAYEAAMADANSFCSGFFGGKAVSFHCFSLLCLLLASNRLVDFYSDQPLVNTVKTFFGFPFHEGDCAFCLHLGEVDGLFQYKGIVPFCVHFNSGEHRELEAVLSTGRAAPPPPRSLKRRAKALLRRSLPR